jgi:soluble lytic murein transglycosylase
MMALMSTLEQKTSFWTLKPVGLGRRGRLGALLGLLALCLSLYAWRSQAFWDALSPVTQKQLLYELAGTEKVDPMLLAAIIKSESGFNPVAESSKGALGLMQLMPDTAAQMAHELKLNYQDADDLYTQDVNLRLGSHYFAKLLKSYNGSLVLALAAYNAGPAKVRAWGLLAWGQDQDLLLDAIPLPETKAYVQRVLWHYRFFKRMQELKRFLNGDAQL